MATKTAVCPECGAVAGPGRYACSECGALLAAVGSMPRSWPTASATGAAPIVGATASVDPAVANGTPSTSSPSGNGVARRPRRTKAPTLEAAVAPPVESTVAPSEVPRPAGATSKPAPPGASAAPAAPPVAVEPANRGTVVSEPRRLAPLADMAHPAPDRVGTAAVAALPGPAWPPAGDHGAAPLPPVRVPAGAYLAPSAVLPPLDAPASARNGGLGTGHDHASPARAKPDRPSRASLADTLDAFGLTPGMPRRLVGVGAAIAGLGFLLPWANVLAGSGLIGDYWTRWGLAGPGHWIVVLALAGLIGLAVGGGALARVPIGGAGMAAAILLVGLLWPYLFGVLGRSVGIWTVLAGAIVLAVGGVLDARRHERTEPPV